MVVNSVHTCVHVCVHLAIIWFRHRIFSSTEVIVSYHKCQALQVYIYIYMRIINFGIVLIHNRSAKHTMVVWIFLQIFYFFDPQLDPRREERVEPPQSRRKESHSQKVNLRGRGIVETTNQIWVSRVIASNINVRIARPGNWRSLSGNICSLTNMLVYWYNRANIKSSLVHFSIIGKHVRVHLPASACHCFSIAYSGLNCAAKGASPNDFAQDKIHSYANNVWFTQYLTLSSEFWAKSCGDDPLVVMQQALLYFSQP